MADASFCPSRNNAPTDHVDSLPVSISTPDADAATLFCRLRRGGKNIQNIPSKIQSRPILHGSYGARMAYSHRIVVAPQQVICRQL